MFIFCFVLVAVFFVTVLVSLGKSEPSWLWIFLWSMLCVLPLTCRLKSELPALSTRLAPVSTHTAPLRGEEVALAVLLLSVVIFAGVKGSYGEAGALFADFFGSIAFAMGAEFVSLIWKVCHARMGFMRGRRGPLRAECLFFRLPPQHFLQNVSALKRCHPARHDLLLRKPGVSSTFSAPSAADVAYRPAKHQVSDTPSRAFKCAASVGLDGCFLPSVAFFPIRVSLEEGVLVIASAE